VPAGSFVLRHPHTPHYDGVPRTEKEPAVIAAVRNRTSGT